MTLDVGLSECVPVPPSTIALPSGGDLISCSSRQAAARAAAIVDDHRDAQLLQESLGAIARTSASAGPPAA